MDTIQYIGPHGDEKITTYKAGRTKLLASKDVEKAARTNDNYAYFAMSMWMKNNFGVYPPYPKMWDNRKSSRENSDNEKNEPGGSSVKSLELEDSAHGDIETKNKPYSKEEYPKWYWPVLENLDKPEIPPLNIPEGKKPLYQVSPNRDAGHCTTDDASPRIDDCYTALGSLYNSMNMTPPLAEGEGREWSGVSTPNPLHDQMTNILRYLAIV